MFGGGMRQAGGIAAAGLIALEESPRRLHVDHENAQVLAKGIAAMPGLKIDPAKVRSNIVIFDCEETGKNAVELCDVLRAGCERALVALEEIVRRPQTARA